MDGRLITVLVGLLLPAVLIAVTIWQFASNPLVLVFLFTLMVIAGFYLLTYQETFRG